jgi:RNA polymerase sigma factor (sigma-70 family)
MTVRTLNPAVRPDDEVLDELYRRHWEELCRYVKRTFGEGPPEPADVVQQAFLTYTSRPKSGGIDSPRAYLYRTAHNIVVDERRKLVGHALVLERLFPVFEEKSDDFTPERVLLGEERLAVLRAAICALPEARRVSFLLNRLQGLSCAEIARRTGYSDSAVKKHVAQAMDALEAALEGAEHGREEGLRDNMGNMP